MWKGRPKVEAHACRQRHAHLVEQTSPGGVTSSLSFVSGTILAVDGGRAALVPDPESAASAVEWSRDLDQVARLGEVSLGESGP
jgi:hypothetical protein